MLDDFDITEWIDDLLVTIIGFAALAGVLALIF